jgi:hypothetical protein
VPSTSTCRIACLASLLLLAACAAPTRVISTDLTRQSGIYVVGYVDRADIRAKLEDRFVADLGAEGLRAVASRGDIARIKSAEVDGVIAAANAHEVAAIVIVNRVAADGAGSPIRAEQKIRPDDPDLKAYFEATRHELDVYGRDEPIYAEVNAFLVDGSRTRRIWTGTTWTFEEDDDAVIASISRTIAAQLAEAVAELRSYGRPMGARK